MLQVFSCGRVRTVGGTRNCALVPTTCIRFCRSGALCNAGYRQSIWQRVSARSRTIDQKSHYFSLIVVVVVFFTLFSALFGKISALFSIFVSRTLPDALYPLHVVFDILVNECQFTFIFYEQEFPEKQALFGG